jgi:hypothetical protein
MTGCVEDIHEVVEPEVPTEQLPDLTAGFDEEQTKTYVENGRYLRWHEGDLITAFFGRTLNNKFMFEGETGDNSGSFAHIPSGKLETGNAIDAIYAVYPYNVNNKFVEGGKLKLYLPSEQEYAPLSFGKGANTMVAVTENTEDTYLAFKNVCGFLKLGLYGVGSVKNIKVQGNNNEQLSGEAYAVPVFAGKPTMEMGEDTEDYVSLVCGEGVELTESATEFWVVLPETTFEKGITITVTTADGAKYVKTTGKEIVIDRNTIQPMAALSMPSDFYVEGANVIEYTATKKLRVTESLEYSSYFGDAHVVAHNYDSRTRKGLIICDRPITTIEANAFSCMYIWDEKDALLSMKLPKTVTFIGENAFHHCDNLNRLYLTSSVPPTIDGDIDENVYNRRDVFVPSDAYDNYNGAITNYKMRVWPYDYASDYPAIPDNEIWYTSDNLSAEATPEMVSGWTVVENRFDEKGRGRIVLSDQVSRLYRDAFYSGMGTHYIQSIILPKRMTAIDKDAFLDWNELKYVYAPANIRAETGSNGEHAFRRCPSLTDFAGGCASEDGCCFINYEEIIVFRGEGITEYVIPNHVTSLGPGSFSSHIELSKVIMPENLKTISSSVFASCGFTEFIVPDTVTSIGGSVFSGCPNLKTVTFGSNVSSIGGSVFSDCTSLESVYFRSTTPPTIGSDFLPADSSAKIYVPRGSIQAYKVFANLGAYYAQMEEYDM